MTICSLATGMIQSPLSRCAAIEFEDLAPQGHYSSPLWNDLALCDATTDSSLVRLAEQHATGVRCPAPSLTIREQSTNITTGLIAGCN